MDELKLYIGADLCWGVDLLPYTRKMRLIPSFVQDNKKAYFQGGADLLEKLLQEGIQVVVSHDPQERIERILNEKTVFLKTFIETRVVPSIPFKGNP